MLLVYTIPASIMAKEAALNAADLYPPSEDNTKTLKSIYDLGYFSSIIALSKTDFIILVNSLTLL